MVGQDVDAASESGDENIQAGVNDEHRVKCAGDDQEGKVRHIHNGRQQFTNETVHCGLGNLNRTADGQSFAYLNLSITGTDMESVNSISDYVHIQKLALQNNLLRDVKGLGSLIHLTNLDVSKNKLNQALRDVPTLPNLRKVDLSSNKIEALGGLNQFPRLSHLTLDENSLQHIDNIIGLKFLTTLSFKRNCLVSAAGLETLQTLRELYLDENRIPTLQPLAMLTCLEVLTASNNFLKDLSGVQSMERLRKIDVSSNQIHNLEDIHHAQKAKYLDEICTQNNPLEKALHSRLHMVHFLPQITILNTQKVSAKEKVLGANLHGANAEEQRLIRRKWFPDGELDDGGGAIPPTSAGMIAWDDATKCVISNRTKEIAASASKIAEHGLSALSAHMATGCSDRLEICITVWYWIVTHLKPPQCTWQPSPPLFDSGLKHMEDLVPNLQGMWSERATGFFIEILHSCGLVAASVSGYCKNQGVWPGKRLISHNHCWSAVKISGRCFPLEAHWQLLAEPLSLASFWKLPMCSIQFMHNGLSLCNPGLEDVKVLEQGREGDPTPTFMIKVTAPKKYKLQQCLLDSNHNPVVRNSYSATFVKVTEKESHMEHELWTAYPTYGEFFTVVYILEDLSAYFSLKLNEGNETLQLDIHDAYEGFRLKVIVPPPKPHEADKGLPDEPFTEILFQTHDMPTVIATGCNLLELINYCPP